ncbi:21 kDa protein [Ricinus communis]|uniref:pectinesterase n=1 Tax=Ricinus communis TaxID=3988 RepID=B9RBP8_RICCO|nr:21 kDa protein [Ricinus communis]EEF50969.1 21 kDa protein precursor, putative [Ricinus communis]|eukprot:XP_002509582.1 21 kDa protein [Ricinus communis]
MEVSNLRPRRGVIAFSILLFSTLIISSSATLPLTNNTSTQYVETSCRNTTYPKLCYDSLAIYATKIDSNPKMLAYVSMNVTLTATRSASELMKNLSRLKSLTPRQAAAIADCVAEIGQAVYELKKSIGEMGRATSGSGTDPIIINDVQTWVSAALTDDTTCMDGFAGHAIDGEVKNIVKENMTKVARLTSIALALINSFGSSSQGENSALVL